MRNRRSPRALRLAAAVATSLALASCGGEAADPAPKPRIADGPHPVAVLELEGLGEIRIELLPELAPQTVASFRKLAGQGFYDGTTFHRVIPDFMIQGGDPLTKNTDPRDDGKGGPGFKVPDEVSGLPHVRGTVSMANKGYADSGGSQFFIVHQDSPQLDERFTIFGRVVSGMDVVDAITELEIDTYGRWGPRDRPYPRDARVTRVRIEPAAASEAADRRLDPPRARG